MKLEVGKDIDFLPGEKSIAAVDSVINMDPYLGNMFGRVIVSNYKLVHQGLDGSLTIVPHGTIERVDKLGGQSSRGENAYGIEVTCKDMRTIKLAFRAEGHSRRKIFEALTQFAFPLSNDGILFAYVFQGHPRAGNDGWRVYQPEVEYQRQGLPSSWRLSRINDAYTVAPTYPAVLGVPASMPDDALTRVALFRSKGRLPALSWVSNRNGASITRCSQPKVGVASKRSVDDETLIAAIIAATPSEQPRLAILDARPRANAVANQAKGYGSESEANYPNTELAFLNIHNIHVMRESLRKIREICFGVVDDGKWFGDLESTGWLKHIKLVLSGSLNVVENIERGVSVLVHCSDGWDRTGQLCGISMLCLDPFYRTIRGFMVLVEKEWLSFGHKFALRIGHGYDNPSDEQRSPIFVQFIDCVWQLTQQYPCSFEFNSAFLIEILDHLFSCLYGTFLTSCEMDRMRGELPSKTKSLWDAINMNLGKYTNSFYTTDPNESPKVLYPLASLRKIALWTEYYLRWNPAIKPKESVEAKTKALQELNDKLQAQLAVLSEEVRRLQSSV